MDSGGLEPFGWREESGRLGVVGYTMVVLERTRTSRGVLVLSKDLRSVERESERFACLIGCFIHAWSRFPARISETDFQGPWPLTMRSSFCVQNQWGERECGLGVMNTNKNLPWIEAIIVPFTPDSLFRSPALLLPMETGRRHKTNYLPALCALPYLHHLPLFPSPPSLTLRLFTPPLSPPSNLHEL